MQILLLQNSILRNQPDLLDKFYASLTPVHAFVVIFGAENRQSLVIGFQFPVEVTVAFKGQICSERSNDERVPLPN